MRNDSYHVKLHILALAPALTLALALTLAQALTLALALALSPETTLR